MARLAILGECVQGTLCRWTHDYGLLRGGDDVIRFLLCKLASGPLRNAMDRVAHRLGLSGDELMEALHEELAEINRRNEMLRVLARRILEAPDECGEGELAIAYCLRGELENETPEWVEMFARSADARKAQQMLLPAPEGRNVRR